jgi:hypothetical protein
VRSTFTNYGTGLDVLAPGNAIWGMTEPNFNSSGTRGYAWWAGTSMATPAFAGAAALVWRFAPSLTPDEISSYLLSTSIKAGSTQPNTGYGWGYLSPTAAYAKLKTDFPYLATTTVTASAMTSRTTVPVRWTSVSGRSVTYDVAVDGSKAVSGTVSLATTLTALADGSHTVVVTPKSNYNWTSGAGTTVTVVVDTIAPTITNLAFSPQTGVITWDTSEEGKTCTTQYYVDGGPMRTLSGTAYDPNADGVTDGPHIFHLQVIDATGNPSGWTSIAFDYATPPSAPVIGSAATGTEAYTLRWGAVAGVTGYEVSLGGVTIETTVGLSADLTLAGGPNSVAVRAVRDAMYAAWATKKVTYTPPMPATPQVSADTSVSVLPTVTVYWSDVPYASRFEYRVNTSTVGPTVDMGGGTWAVVVLTKGVNTVQVRAVNYSGASNWASLNVRFVPPVPVAPDPSVSSTETVQNLVTLSWLAVPDAVRYDYRVGTAGFLTTAATGVDITSLLRGDNALAVRSRSLYDDVSTWATVTVRYDPPVVYSISGALVAPLTYGGSSSISATLRGDDGSVLATPTAVAIEQSTDSASWVAFANTTSTVAGSIAYPVKPSRTTYYRLTFTGGAPVVLRADVKPVLYTPHSPSRHNHHSFTVYGYLKPRHTAHKVNVTIKAYLRNSHGQYVLKKTFKMTNYNYSSYTKYSGSVALPYNGKWRLYASYAGTTTFASAQSTYRILTVK